LPAEGTEDDVGSYEFGTHFIGDAPPNRCRIMGNPLDYAGKRIGLDVRNVELPGAHEGNYRFACRFPIIDCVSNRPLYMIQWAEDRSSTILCEHRAKGIGATDYLLEVICGRVLDTGDGDAREDSVCEMLSDSLRAASFSPNYCRTVLRLFRTYCGAVDLVRRARENLSDEDLRFFFDNPGYYLAPDGNTMPSLTGDVDTHFEFIERARRVKYEYIFSAAKLLSGDVHRYVTETRDFASGDFHTDPAFSKKVFTLDTPYGAVVIAGFGRDARQEGASFFIDLGGDDRHGRGAGSAGFSKNSPPVSLCIDHSGNDIYTVGSNCYTQGFGFLGCGMLVDCSGNDSYSARHFSQGAGIMGVGILWDIEGDDEYDAHAFCQGAGMFGLGALLDNRGRDSYSCATLGQGGATTLGLGLLCDLEGDDRYNLAMEDSKDALGRTPGYGQGGALSFRHYPWKGRLTPYGGVGMLIEGGGKDRYRSRGWCDQGGSYIMSLGVLVDRDGDDVYSSHCGQGSGIHITSAILLDHAGDDRYEGEFRAGGSGGDRSSGFLIDYRGNDTYSSETSSYGTGVKPFSFSLFIDYEGNDTYLCGKPEDRITFNNWDSFGGVWPESEPHLWPFALCLDLGGVDDYRVRYHANDTERHSFGHGIHIDIQWNGGDVVGKVEPPLEPYDHSSLKKTLAESRYRQDIELLRHPDTYIRFQTIGRIVAAGTVIVPPLVDAMLQSTHRQFNRDAMECLHYLFHHGKITDDVLPDVLKLLGARDEEVRTIMADNFGLWKVMNAEVHLIESLHDENASVRKCALRSLIRIESPKAYAVARGLALHDPSEGVRRMAVNYLSTQRDDPEIVTVIARILEEETASSVKVAAAEGLRRIANQGVVKELRRAAKSEDVYLQRAAGKALAELNHIEGVEILIQSLSFPSIDAFHNYDRNIPNLIAGYVNFDFPEDRRYEQDEWFRWFQAHRDSIDLASNVRALREFRTLEEHIEEEPAGIAILRYEEFLEKHPGYLNGKRTLARILNREAWKKVTSPRSSSEFDPVIGLRYALRAVELVRDVNYMDTLAEAYLAAGHTEKAAQLCRKMLQKYPDERMFTERLKRCEFEARNRR
jgi:hypothetical protein